MDQFAFSQIYKAFGIGQSIDINLGFKPVCTPLNFLANLFPLPFIPIRNMGNSVFRLLQTVRRTRTSATPFATVTKVCFTRHHMILGIAIGAMIKHLMQSLCLSRAYSNFAILLPCKIIIFERCVYSFINFFIIQCGTSSFVIKWVNTASDFTFLFLRLKGELTWCPCIIMYTGILSSLANFPAIPAGLH